MDKIRKNKCCEKCYKDKGLMASCKDDDCPCHKLNKNENTKNPTIPNSE